MDLKKFIVTLTVEVSAEGQCSALLMAEEMIAEGKGTTRVREDSGRKPGRPAKLALAAE